MGTHVLILLPHSLIDSQPLAPALLSSIHRLGTGRLALSFPVSSVLSSLRWFAGELAKLAFAYREWCCRRKELEMPLAETIVNQA